MATGMATRCSACGTVFRVVPDQLRVSEGWVRCGRCAEVFNAAEALLDLETGAPRGAQEEPRAMPRGTHNEPAAMPRAMAQFTSSRLQESPAPAPVPAPAEAQDFSRDMPPPRPAPEARTMPVVDDAESRFADNAADSADFSAEPRSDAPATPSFVRQAERAARWRRPGVRAGLLAGAVVASLLLAAQVAFECRDLAAARFPALREPLQAACAALGCTVSAAHIIEGLVVESSGLVRVEKSGIYRLSVALRNHASLEVALPALELSLTDAQGKLVARRVLNATELGVNQATLAAGRDLALQATLRADTAPVAGYTIELFYP